MPMEKAIVSARAKREYVQAIYQHYRHAGRPEKRRILDEIDDGIWNVYFGPLKLGRLLERQMRIEDAYGRLKRRTV